MNERLVVTDNLICKDDLFRSFLQRYDASVLLSNRLRHPFEGAIMKQIKIVCKSFEHNVQTQLKNK